MATLVRPRLVEHDATDLHKHIPTPFPLQQLIDLQADVLDDLAAEPMDYADSRASPRSFTVQPSPYPFFQVAQCQNDIQASVTAVLAESPLSCLVHALGARCGYPHTVDHPPSEAVLLSQLHDLVDAIVPSLGSQDAHPAQAIVALLLDLEQLPASLALTSAQLVSPTDPSQHSENGSGPPPPPTSPYATIASLQRQLSSLQPAVASTSSGSRPTPAESVQSALLWARIDEQLEIVVSLCRARALSSPPHHGMTEPSPFGLVVHPSESHNSNNDRPSFDDALPPYDSDCHHYSNERPPSYIAEGYPFASSKGKPNDEKSLLEQYPPEKVSSRVSTSTFPADTGMTTERDHAMSSNSLDLDAITHAIERLYVVAPQLANQRVELRREKLMQMEKAKQGKGKARTLADIADPELDKMLDLLGRASAREIPDQSVVVDPYRTARGVGTADIEEQRRKYLEHLVHRTSAGRLHSQDAVPSLGRSSPSSTGGALQDRESSEKEPEGRSSRDGKRASYPSEPKSGSTLEPPPDRLRNRSLSAPHLAWLRPKEKTGSANGTKEGFGSITRTLSSDPKSLPSSATSKSVRSFSGRLRGVSKTRPSSAGEDGVSLGALDIAYVAEHHETLKHVLLFIACMSPSSSLLGGVPLAEVLPSTSSGTHGDCLFLRLGGTPSPPLALPVPVVPGSKSVLSRGGHWEVKASCYQSGVVPKESEDAALLPASELASLSPSSYVCSSCSLPLVPTPPTRYRDLPSEHWEELIDSWMCHPEGQTLAKTGMHGDDSNGKASGFGFWPTRDEALVGGSYVLFDAQAVVGGNIKRVGVRERGGHSRLARCLCGAIVGREHDRRQEHSSVSRMYRLFKYAIRPISTTSQAPKIPMSAFVLHDMLEHVQAHATYRFVLSDEEDERPRLLIWLFKPRIRISYMLAAPALLPKSGTLDGAKVLYKILGPSTTSDLKDILNKYPGFPQAEYLFYPMDVCRKLAALLKESTASYPEGMRTMTGLDVGWLVMT
ncbi:HECT-like ubiquitin-conjugating enzyme-binding-domain-containing protein [Boletus reticuloceps]|uniref:HECT-like ubiquitin-conjugating enzyme-binding-domain-containing protein n=1 Tax=Boletus reticuloceps TaxID=495285 RepID=A0A8I2YUA6_9AGAM|nr:HECT-like ubiquitin-conjugating enzyme-binding-domain-containing protein [Boletus reticuloceps]